MSSHEIHLASFIYTNINNISFAHIDTVNSIGIPNDSPGRNRHATSLVDISQISIDDSRKKADFYINNFGISLKKIGGSFSFNRLQRANMLSLFNKLGFSKPADILMSIDQGVEYFHSGTVGQRNRDWSDFFSDDEFYALLDYLMMKGSPNLKDSANPADFIMEAPASGFNAENIVVRTFDEYFNTYREKFKIAVRRSWIGQDSKSEHGRAKSLSNKEGNQSWIYDTISGTPRSGWQRNFPESDRRTVYYLMIEKTV
jgi:hypothetical protein